MKEIPQNVSESTKRRNPHLFGVGQLENPQRQSNERSESKDPIVGDSAPSVAFRVHVISIRKRLCDEHDNLRTGAKPLVDEIARSLGFSDDSDKHLTWVYTQIRSDGPSQGTIVKIDATQT